MRACVFCKKKYEKGSGVTFHKFPTDSTKEIWLKNMKFENFSPKSSNHLCSQHFTEDCFIKHASRTALKYGSVPTVFFENEVNSPPVCNGMVKATCLSESVGVKREWDTIDEEDTDIDKSKYENEIFPVNSPSVCNGIGEATCVSESHAVKSEWDSFDEEDTVINQSRYENEIFSVNSPSVCNGMGKVTCVSEPVGVKREWDSIDEEDTDIDQLSTNGTQMKFRTISEVCENVKHEHNYDNTPPRSIFDVCFNIRHDHRYENTSRSKRKKDCYEINRMKKSLKMSRARVKLLTQHVKRLKTTVSSLKKVIKDLKRNAVQSINRSNDFSS